MNEFPAEPPRLEAERGKGAARGRDRRSPARGFFPPQIVKAVCFYVISFCIVASVVVCILAIWDFTKKDSLWRLVASFVVVGAGTSLFAVVNGVFGDDREG